MIELLLEAERTLTAGAVDHAERIYRQVLAADPRNGIAVVGLARVRLEQGDELGAYLEARRALGIDPENAAARRLVARLEETFAYRGDALPGAPIGSASIPVAAPTPPPPPTLASPVDDRDETPEPVAPDPPSPPPRPKPGLLGRILGRGRR